MNDKKNRHARDQHARSNMTTPLSGQDNICPDSGVAMPSHDEVMRAKEWVDDHEV